MRPMATKGLAVSLPDERVRLVLQHPEMAGLDDEIEQTVAGPDVVVQSVSDRESCDSGSGGGMGIRCLTIWYDREGDFLEVMFEDRAGYFRETANDQVMEKVDDQGCVIGVLDPERKRGAICAAGGRVVIIAVAETLRHCARTSSQPLGSLSPVTFADPIRDPEDRPDHQPHSRQVPPNIAIRLRAGTGIVMASETQPFENKREYRKRTRYDAQ